MGLGAALSPSWTVNGLSLTTYPFSVPFDGPDYGTPDVAVDTLISFLTRGDLEHTSHTGNRTLTLPVDIEGSNLSALADAEALLKAAVDVEFGELLVDPGDGVAPSFKFNIFRGVMAFQRLDAWEMSGIRRFTLTFRAEPDVYSAVLTTVAALAASGSTTTNVDAGSSTTGWTAKVNGSAVSPSVVSGAVVAQSGSALTAATIAMTRTGSIATSSTPYIVVDWKAAAGTAAIGGLSATGDGVALQVVASRPSPTAGYTRTTFSVAASSVTALVLTLVAGTPSRIAVVFSLSIDNIARTDIRPTLGTPAQQIRTLAIGGSAPTIGSVAIEHATSALGDVILYTCPDDGSAYQPSCRLYKTSAGSATSDATAVSGFYDTVTSSALNMVYGIPSPAMPNGEYEMVARLSNPAPGNITVTVTAFASVAGLPVGTLDVKTHTVAVGVSWALLPLGVIHLPNMDVSTNPATLQNVSLQTGGGTTVRIDELYLFNKTTGQLSRFSCGSGAVGAGGSANRLWIDSPAIENSGYGRYLMGYSADRSDAYSAYPSMVAEGVHEFRPGSLKVFTVATNPTTAVDVSFAYFAAWANHAAA